jgi:small subunit ribosomal protein S16
VAVKIKLKRMGKMRNPQYRIVVADARTKRDGRAIEEIGKYHPKAEPSFIEVDSERAQHWLSVGAQPTDPVRKILEVTGDWQKFKGLPGAEGTLRTAEPKADRKVAFAAAVAETLTESGAKSKPKARTDAKAADAKAGDTKAGEAKSGAAKAGEAKAGEAKAEKAEKPAKPKQAAESKDAAPAPADASAEADAAATAEAKAEALAEVAADSATDDSAGDDSAATDSAGDDSAATESAATESAATDSSGDADGSGA